MPTPDELARGDVPAGSSKKGCLDTLFGMVWVFWSVVVGLIYAGWFTGVIG